MATINVNPLSAGDSTIYSNDNTSWANSRGAAAGTAVRGGSTGFIQWTLSGGTTYVCERYFATFDTSAIGSGAIVTAATLTFNGTGKTGSEASSVNIYASTCADTLTTADFSALTLNSPTAWATAITSANWSTTGSNVFTFNAAGLAGINTTGKTKLCMRDVTFDVNNSASPTVQNYVQTDLGSAVTKVQLSVTYTAGGAVALPFRALLGVGI